MRPAIFKSYPGAQSEGRGWEAISPRPAESNFNGCGWMSIFKRLDREGSNSSAPKCKKYRYALSDFVRKARASGGGAPASQSKYPQFYIWATAKVDDAGNVVLGKDGKPLEIDGMAHRSRARCRAYGNTNRGRRIKLPGTDHAAKRHAVLRGGRRGTQDPVSVAVRVVDPETDERVYFVLAHTKQSYAPWVWFSAKCLF